MFKFIAIALWSIITLTVIYAAWAHGIWPLYMAAPLCALVGYLQYELWDEHGE